MWLQTRLFLLKPRADIEIDGFGLFLPALFSPKLQPAANLG